jgi:ferredoxin-NADP reductase
MTPFEGAQAVETEIARRERKGAQHNASIAHHLPKRIELTVAEVITETASTKTFRVRRADGGELPPFLAGQYVNLHVNVDGIATRPMAISSSPARLDAYDLTVRRVPSGRVSNYLIDHVAVGERLASTGPMGTFHHHPLFHSDDVVFIAGGSGVAPAMSMIRDIVDHDLPRRLHLIYGSRRQYDVIFAHQLEVIAAGDPRVRVDHVILYPEPDWRGRSGLITAETISTVAGALERRMVYVCGPQAMYPYVLEQLAELGHPRRRVRFEAHGTPSRPETQPGWPTELDPVPLHDG